MKTNMRARRFGTIARWGACFTLVLGAHAAGAMALLDWRADIAAVASAPVILIDFAPVPAAPTITTSALPPGPQQPQTQAEPQPEPEPEAKKEAKPDQTPPKPVEQPVDIKPAPAPEALLAVMPPPRPATQSQRTKRQQRQASLASAPSAANRRAARPAAPAPGAARRNSDAVPDWKSRLVARLERYKRYPNEAQRRGEHGVVQIAFNIDRRGGVHDVRIVRSSGSPLLDRTTLALPRRAAPLPPPPPDFDGRRIPIVVPIRYNIR
jgi:protein TonB